MFSLPLDLELIPVSRDQLWECSWVTCVGEVVVST